MTPLANAIARRILLQGPISVAAFMAEALGHPEHGYYMRGDPFGRAGDFITAPEISQVFGELIGLWCAEMWRLMGQPDPVLLVELGPGRGTLMADAIRASKVLREFHDAVSVQLVETSPALRRRQADTLSGIEPEWHDDFAGVPEGPIILVANEFFDALPIHQFERGTDGWRERLIAVEDGTLRRTLGPSGGAGTVLIPQALREQAPVGAVFEVSPAAVSMATAIGQRIAGNGGAALIVDYGHASHTLGATWQAVRAHTPHDVLQDPGTADLTAHVDFAALAAAVRPYAAVHGAISQATLLRRLGLEMRAEQLLRHASGEQRTAITTACNRLIDPAEMGTLFKALAICHGELAAPPGFEETANGC